MQELTDQQLIGLYLGNNDDAAFQVLIERYLNSIYGFVRNYTGKADDVADITQEVFVKVWYSLKTFDRSRPFKTWLFAIARNTAIDWLKKKQAVPFSMLNTQEQEDQFQDTIADTAMSVLESLVLLEEARPVLAALNSLPVGHSSIIQLHSNQGMTFQEIADKLGKPLNTVKSQYRRTIEKVRQMLT